MQRLVLGVSLMALSWLLCAAACAETYYVDFDGGNDTADGRSPQTAFKRCPGDAEATGTAASTALQPGDTVLFKGGVTYRGSVVCKWSGAEGKPITYDGNTQGSPGTGRAVLDGAEIISAWTRCRSADECGGNPHWQDIYWADAPFPTDPFLANLYQGEQMLWPAQDPNMKDPFYPDSTEEYRPFDTKKASPTTLVDDAYLTQADPRAWDGAYVAIWAQPNYVYFQKVTGYNPAAHEIAYDKLPAAHYPDRPGRYSMLNSLQVLDQPGECVIRDEGGKSRIYLWPLGKEDFSRGAVSISRRTFGFDLNGNSYVAIRGFLIRGFASCAPHRGAGITNDVGSPQGLLLRDNVIARCTKDPHSGWKHAGLSLFGASRSTVENNEVYDNRGCGGIYFGGEGMVVQNNLFRKTGYVGIWVMGATNAKVLGNTVLDSWATHSNAISVYSDSRDVLVFGNKVFNSARPLTTQASQGVTVACNVFSTSGVAIADWGGCTGLKFFNNVLLSEGGGAAVLIQGGSTRDVAFVNNILSGVSIGNVSGLSGSHNLFVGRSGARAGIEGQTADLDAVFTDAAQRDFRLKPGSPAIDAGTDVGLDHDIVGAAVPQGKAPDIGPYEYVPPTAAAGQ